MQEKQLFKRKRESTAEEKNKRREKQEKKILEGNCKSKEQNNEAGKQNREEWVKVEEN